MTGTKISGFADALEETSTISAQRYPVNGVNDEYHRQRGWGMDDRGSSMYLCENLTISLQYSSPWEVGRMSVGGSEHWLQIFGRERAGIFAVGALVLWRVGKGIGYSTAINI